MEVNDSVCVCVSMQTSSSPSMDGVLEVLSKSPDDRTDEDIGEWATERRGREKREKGEREDKMGMGEGRAEWGWESRVG